MTREMMEVNAGGSVTMGTHVVSLLHALAGGILLWVALETSSIKITKPVGMHVLYVAAALAVFASLDFLHGGVAGLSTRYLVRPRCYV
jgi:hypothetical protein